METLTESVSGFGIIMPIVMIVVALILIGATIASRYKVCGPDEAIIVTGTNAKKTKDDLPAAKVVQGGGVFVIPFIQRAHSLSLASRQIGVQAEAISKNGITLSLNAVAVVKVNGSDEDIRSAAQRFLNQQEAVERFTEETLEGSLRAIIGSMTVEQIINDRADFASKVQEEALSSMANQGLAIDTFQIQGISDNNSGYLKNLGRPEEAEVERRAAISEANAKREAERARIAAEQDILDARRERDLREAEIKKETQAADAEAAAAGPRAKAVADQKVLEEEQKVAERRVSIRQQELEAEISRKADADRYAAEQEADAKKYSRIAEAEAAARQVQLEAEAEANRVKLAGEAEAANRRSIAEAIEDEGRAEATATREKGIAEAETMRQKAMAYNEYNDAAIVSNFINILPEVVKEASAPMSNIDSLTVIDTQGASKLTQSVSNNVAQGSEVLSSLGFDVKSLLNNFTGILQENQVTDSNEEKENS